MKLFESKTRFKESVTKGSYKGVDYTINKLNKFETNGDTQYYWRIESMNEGGDDWFGKKNIAVSAVKEYIDEIKK